MTVPLLFAAQRLRLDWGFGNPNITAALIASLLLAVWALPELLRGYGPRVRAAAFYAALAASVALAHPLMATRSRGGLVAVVAGLGLLLAYAPRPWPRVRVVASVAALALCAYWAWDSGASRRLAADHVAQDASIGNRLKIWKHAPAMIADAPGGWGAGRGTRAYLDWYQETNWYQDYDTLVSSHVTALVECGVAGRLAYVGGWIAAFWLVWPGRPGAGGAKEPGRPVAPAAILTGWFLAMVFSCVAEWPLWIVPGLALLGMAIRRWRHEGFSPRGVVIALGVSLGAAAVLLLAALPFAGRSGVRASDGGETVRYGDAGAPAVVLIAGEGVKESPRRLRELRDAGLLPAPVLWTRVPERAEKPDAPTSLVLLGRPDPTAVREWILRAPRVILPAPAYEPRPMFEVGELAKVSAYYGEFSDTALSRLWRASGRCETLPGMADFIPDWPDRIFAAVGKPVMRPPEPEETGTPFPNPP